MHFRRAAAVIQVSHVRQISPGVPDLGWLRAVLFPRDWILRMGPRPEKIGRLGQLITKAAGDFGITGGASEKQPAPAANAVIVLARTGLALRIESGHDGARLAISLLGNGVRGKREPIVVVRRRRLRWQGGTITAKIIVTDLRHRSGIMRIVRGLEQGEIGLWPYVRVVTIIGGAIVIGCRRSLPDCWLVVVV